MRSLRYCWRELVVMGLGSKRNGSAEGKLLSFARGHIGERLPVNSELRVLDLGCGHRYPALSVFTAWGWDATGIDVCRVGPGFSLKKYMSVVRTEGKGRALRSLVRENVFDPIYRKELYETLNLNLTKKPLDIRLMSAADMEFEDNTFDLVYSMAVFEHIDDVPGAVREVCRVLKPTGIAYLGLSLWPCIIGGHHAEWMRPDEYQPKDVPPWDHLRQNVSPAPIYCNKYRERDFREVLEKYTDILEWIDGPRIGESLLTDEILAELPDYTAEELTKWSATAIVRKKSQ